MIQAIKDDYNDLIYQEALRRFGFKAEETKALKGFESYVYDCKRTDENFILKVTHTLRRTVDYLLGELEFVNHLVDHGLHTIPRAIPSPSNQLIECIDLPNQHSFLVYAFEKAPGERINETTWTAASFYELGKVTGLMHQLAKDYTPSKSSYRRQEWFNDDFLNVEKHCKPIGEQLYKNAQNWLNEARALPKNNKTYGLVHADLHYGNFFIHKGEVFPFDFDDCEYHYYIADTAISLYYFLNSSLKQKSKKDFYAFFLEHYLKGYETVAHYTDKDLKQIPLFMKLRSLLLYNVLMEVYDWDSLSEEEQKRFELHKKYLEADIDVIDYDWSIL